MKTKETKLNCSSTFCRLDALLFAQLTSVGELKDVAVYYFHMVLVFFLKLGLIYWHFCASLLLLKCDQFNALFIW